jgi:hypothetical protein
LLPALQCLGTVVISAGAMFHERDRGNRAESRVNQGQLAAEPSGLSHFLDAGQCNIPPRGMREAPSEGGHFHARSPAGKAASAIKALTSRKAGGREALARFVVENETVGAEAVIFGD